MHRSEVKLRTNLLNEPKASIRPLNELVVLSTTICPRTNSSRPFFSPPFTFLAHHSISAKAVTNGATALAEGFLFFVGISLIAGEAYRSSRSNSKRRDDVDDRLNELDDKVGELKKLLDKSLKGDEDGDGVEGRLDAVDDRCVTVAFNQGHHAACRRDIHIQG